MIILYFLQLGTGSPLLHLRQPGGSPVSTVHGLQWIENNRIISGCEDGRLLCFDLRSGGVIWNCDPNEKLGGVSCLAQWTDGKQVIVGHNSGMVSAWQALEGRLLSFQPLHTEEIRSLSLSVSPMKLATGIANLTKLRVLLVSASSDGCCGVWEDDESYFGKASGFDFQERCMLRGHGDKVLCAAFIPGKFEQVLSSGADGKVLLWTPS